MSLLYNDRPARGKAGRDRETEGSTIREENSPTRYIDEAGPFDVIGDVHGCLDELAELLDRLGYAAGTEATGSDGREEPMRRHPEGRRAVFLGDITDRGPDSVGCIRLVAAMVRDGAALYVPGNHCRKLYRYLQGRDVVMQHGIETTAAELAALSEEERAEVTARFVGLYEGAPVHLVLDRGRLVVAHAGIREEMIGHVSKRIESFCLFGDTTGERTEEGFPVRRDWAREYEGEGLVVYGHTPVEEPVIRYNTVNIDQGCVFGGRLTALRYPEGQFVQAEARAVYAPRRGFSDSPAQ